jgi:hypothetical protein
LPEFTPVQCTAAANAWAAPHSALEIEAMRTLSAAIGLGLTLALCDAQAQDLEAAKACTSLGDSAERLACYDAALRVTKAPNAPQSRVKNSGTQAQFGDNGQLQRDQKSKPEVPKSLTGQVQQVTALANGRYRLTLDNGQVWQTDPADWAMTFKVGDTVTITRFSLGGYQISLAGNRRSAGAKRIR